MGWVSCACDPMGWMPARMRAKPPSSSSPPSAFAVPKGRARGTGRTMWRSAHRRGPDDAERRMLRRGEIKMHGFFLRQHSRFHFGGSFYILRARTCLPRPCALLYDASERVDRAGSGGRFTRCHVGRRRDDKVVVWSLCSFTCVSTTCIHTRVLFSTNHHHRSFVSYLSCTADVTARPQ